MGFWEITQYLTRASVTGDTGASRERFIRETGLAAVIAELAEPVLEDLGFRLVRVQIQGRESKIVQIMAERPDGTITVNDCEAISRQISPLLDVHDVISGSYRLEISSPGIDRPLVRPSDFEDWADYEAKIELSEMIDGRKRFRGRLDGFEDGEVRIEIDLPEIGRTVVGFPVSLVSDAKLVLTDDLVREALRRAKQSKRADGTDDDVGHGDEIDLED